MQKNNIHKKSLKKKLLTSTLLVLGLAFVLVGFTGFASPKTTVTQAYASGTDYTTDLSNSHDFTPSTEKMRAIDPNFSIDINISQSTIEPLTIPVVAKFSNYISANKIPSNLGFPISQLPISGSTSNLFVKSKVKINVYDFYVARTTDKDFFYDNETNLFSETLNKYNIEYHKVEPTSDTIRYDWSIDNSKLDTKYYYFNFVVARHNYVVGVNREVKGGSAEIFRFGYNLERIVSYSNISNAITTRELLSQYFENESNLSQDVKENRNDAIRKTLGSNKEISTVTVEWIEMTSYSSFQTVSDTIEVDSTYLGCKDFVFKEVLNKLPQDEAKDFNAIHKEYFYDAVTNEYLLIGKRIVRIVDEDNPFTYIYDCKTDTATLSINYEPYQYNDLALIAKNNDENNLLQMHLYPTDIETESVKIDSNTYKDYCTLIWDYDEIYQELYNSCKWLILIEPEDISYSVSGGSRDFGIIKTNESLSVTFPADSPENLFGIDITLTCIIVPDEDYTVKVSYYDVDDNYSATRITTESTVMKLSKVINLTDKTFANSNFYTDYVVPGLTVDDEIVDCFKYKDVDIQWDRNSNIAILYVEYSPATVICLKNDLTEDTNYRLLGRQSTFNVDELNFIIPFGYRIKNITVDEKFKNDVKIKFNELSPSDSKVTFFCSTKLEEQIVLIAELSDTWLIEFDYLFPYKDSCFSTLEHKVSEIKVADVPDINNITIKNLCDFAFGGINNMNICASVPKISKVSEKDLGVFELTLEYSPLSVKAQDSDGSYTEVLVYLTPYSVWNEYLGKDFSLMWLNTPENEFFDGESYNTISTDKLYGFFTQFVWSGQQLDLNEITSKFTTGTAEGGIDEEVCRVVYEAREVSGSDLYKWADSRKNNIGTITISYITIALSEAVSDDNKVYYSYFTYFDGNSVNNFVSRSGADDYDDNTGALPNFTEDVGKDIADWWENSSPAKVIKVILYVLLGLLVLFLIIKFAIWLFKDRN